MQIPNIELIKQQIPKDFHPADYYNELINIENWTIKAMAESLGLPYKNKRIFIKDLIKKMEYIKENNL